MKKVEATKEKSDKGQVEDLLKAMTRDQRKINTLAVKMQDRTQAIMELAEDHPEWFKGKTANLENGALKYEASSKPVIPADVDLDDLATEYPSLVKVTKSVPVGALRTFLEDEKHGAALRDAGFDIESVDKFKVIPNG